MSTAAVELSSYGRARVIYTGRRAQYSKGVSVIVNVNGKLLFVPEPAGRGRFFNARVDLEPGRRISRP